MNVVKHPLLMTIAIAATLLLSACGDKKKADEKQSESGTSTTESAADSSTGDTSDSADSVGSVGETSLDFMTGTWVYVPSDDSPNFWKKRPPLVTINPDRSVSALIYEVQMKGVLNRVGPHAFSARILSTMEDGKEMPARDGSELIMKYDSAANLVRLTSDKGFDDDKHPFKKVDDAVTDSLAVLFATKAYIFPSFPFTGEWNYLMLRQGSGEKINLDFGANGIEGFIPEMKYRDEFISLFRQVYYQKERPLAGWLPAFAKRVASKMRVPTYVGNGYDAMTRQLLVAYDDLSSRPGAFGEVYDIMVKNGNKSSVDAIYEILPYACPEMLPIFTKTKGGGGYVAVGEVNRWGVVWAYSFWARRHHENPANVEPIAATLRMLRDEVFKFQQTGKSAAAIPAKCPERTGTLSHAGQTYKTVRIGGKEWMAENLNARGGNSWCYGNDEGNCKKYGRLYDWNAAMKACPAGWRLPRGEDWSALATGVGATSFENDYESGYRGAGKALKSKAGWGGSDFGGSDRYGFAALPGGGHSSDEFYNEGANAFFWSASAVGGNAFRWSMAAESGDLYNGVIEQEAGFSVRCVKN